MKIIFTIILIFIGLVIIDGILLPSLFHIYGGLLGLAFMASLIIVYGTEPSVIILGLLIAFVLEALHGFYLASIVSAWLCGIFIWLMIKRFFNIEPLIEYNKIQWSSFVPLLGIGYILVVAISVIFLLVGKFVYQSEATWTTLWLIALSPMIWLITGCGLVFCMLLMRLPGQKSMPSAGKFYI
jgi:hypothetical protein